MANLPALYGEAWTAPRQSMRRILSLSLSERDRVFMVAVTGVLFAIPLSLMMRAMEMPVGPDGAPLPAPSTLTVAIMTVTITLLSYYISAALIRILGGLFGGTATYTESKSVAAWTQFVVGLANLGLLLLSFVLPAVIDDALRLIFTLAALFISSAYVAEAHGFRSTGRVVGVSVVVVLVLMLLMAPFMPAEMLQTPQ